MYGRHFGLSRPPFSIAPDPRYLFMSERHREALAHLLYGVGAGGGFVVLTGEIGAGKTTICRSFLEQIPERCEVAYIFNPKLSVDELLASVCAEFRIQTGHTGPGTATVKEYVDALNEYLLRTHALGRTNVLIIDEAQSLSADVLEQLRLLTNLETAETKLLQIVLIGQPELRAMLARPGMEQLAQRVIARYHLDALGEVESMQYIRHRLAVAGLTQPVPFDHAAMRRIYRYSRGVPRRINLLCDRALLGAYAKGKTRVDRRTVDEAAREVLDAPDRAAIRRARFERPVLVGLGLAAGALLVGALALVPIPGTRQGAAGTGDASAPLAAGAPMAAGARAIQPAEAPAAQSDGVFAAVASAAQEPGPTVAQGSAPEAVAMPDPPERAAGESPPAGELPPGSAPATAAAALFDLPSGFASLIGDADDSWRALARAWKLAPISGDACSAARKQEVYCYRNASSTLALIRQLDRPGILTLRDGRNRTAQVMLSGLSDEDATLQIDGVPRSVSLVSLADYWRGEFATFWRVPPGYTGSAAGVARGAGARWLAQQLATARGDTAPMKVGVDAEALKGWVRAFQLAQGLSSDGIAGPITLMRLNRMTGVDEPRLDTGG